MPNFERLTEQLNQKIRCENADGSYFNGAYDEKNVLRRQAGEELSLWRTPFVQDIDKIMNCPYFSRYADKTQVYSLYKNDDMTRRSLHVQFVSRIARTIGKALHLNLDLRSEEHTSELQSLV